MLDLIPSVKLIQNYQRKLAYSDMVKEPLKTVADLQEWAASRTLKQHLINHTKAKGATDVVGNNRQLSKLANGLMAQVCVSVASSYVCRLVIHV